MNDSLIKHLNVIILSMATKQKIFDELHSVLFNADIYRGYMDNLIQINLELMNKPHKKSQYERLISSYIENESEDPNNIIKKLTI